MNVNGISDELAYVLANQMRIIRQTKSPAPAQDAILELRSVCDDLGDIKQELSSVSKAKDKCIYAAAHLILLATVLIRVEDELLREGKP